MTCLAVLADIHGNLPALEAVFRDMAHFTVDRVIVAGDVINWGPFSVQVMEQLTARNCAVIRGNNELYITDWNTPRAPQHWQTFTIAPFTLAQLGDTWVNVIATWPDVLVMRFRDAPAVRVVHGNPRSHFEAIMPHSTDVEVEAMLDGVEETTVIAGHSHLALDRTIGHWHILNPGSVGVPLDSILTASYMILEGDQTGWRAILRRVPFDLEPLLSEFARIRFIEQCGVVGYLAVEEMRTAQMEVAPFLMWWSRTCPHEPHTMSLLDRYPRASKRDFMPAGY